MMKEVTDGGGGGGGDGSGDDGCWWRLRWLWKTAARACVCVCVCIVYEQYQNVVFLHEEFFLADALVVMVETGRRRQRKEDKGYHFLLDAFFPY
jgi:hypothetical protein